METCDRECVIGRVGPDVCFDIAILGIRPGRLRTEGDDRAILRMRNADLDCLQECVTVSDHVIRRHEQQDLVASVPPNPCCGERGCDGGIAALRFQ
jgi:hypothetical protein